jgi:hypothetical protein
MPAWMTTAYGTCPGELARQIRANVSHLVALLLDRAHEHLLRTGSPIAMRPTDEQQRILVCLQLRHVHENIIHVSILGNEPYACFGWSPMEVCWALDGGVLGTTYGQAVDMGGALRLWLWYLRGLLANIVSAKLYVQAARTCKLQSSCCWCFT